MWRKSAAGLAYLVAACLPAPAYLPAQLLIHLCSVVATPSAQTGNLALLVCGAWYVVLGSNPFWLLTAAQLPAGLRLLFGGQCKVRFLLDACSAILPPIVLLCLWSQIGPWHERICLLLFVVYSFNVTTDRMDIEYCMAQVLFYRVAAFLQGTNPLVDLSDDPKLFGECMKANSNKGKMLEYHFSCSAWEPILSVESVDGELWEQMHARMITFMKTLPSVEELEAIANQNCADMVAAKAPVDAHAVMVYTLSTFLKYLFGIDYDEQTHGVLIAASMEWRKELAIKGKGNLEIENAAIAVIVECIKDSSLWEQHGEAWTTAPYFSLIMQPFIISPLINVGDIAVAFEGESAVCGDSAIFDVIRRYHPFPILERELSNGPVRHLKQGTQVMFVPRNADSQEWGWSVFGIGPRKCMGAAHAMALLRPLAALVGSPLFVPSRGHKYSGRHRDGKDTNTVYLYSTVIPLLGRIYRNRKGPRNE
eukprot:m.252499 g.252499  ORF g.252499 m.252499 type:complete len:478 (+) comp54523_c0_seq1:211-1644(+)